MDIDGSSNQFVFIFMLHVSQLDLNSKIRKQTYIGVNHSKLTLSDIDMGVDIH